MTTDDLTLIAEAVGVLTDPTSPEGTGTTLHYLLATILGLTPILAMWQGGWL